MDLPCLVMASNSGPHGSEVPWGPVASATSTGTTIPGSASESVSSSASSRTVQPAEQCVMDLGNLLLIGRQDGRNFVGKLAGFRALPAAAGQAAEIPTHLLVRLFTFRLVPLVELIQLTALLI